MEEFKIFKNENYELKKNVWVFFEENKVVKVIIN